MQNDNINIIVTGSTPGIGLATVEILAKRTDKAYNIYITSRKQANAEKAVEKLAAKLEGTNSTFNGLELNLGNKDSIDAFVANLVAQDLKFDIFVNNAAVHNYEKANQTDEDFHFQWDINYTNTRYLTEQLLDNGRVKENGKIINVSSHCGKWTNLRKSNPEIFEKLQGWESFGYKEVGEIEQAFLEDRKTEEGKKKWPNWVYFTTKIFLNLFTYVLGKDPRVTENGIQVYALCPGFTDTGMTASFEGWERKTTEQAAQTTIYLIDLPFGINQELQGGFFEDEKHSSYNSEAPQYE